MLPPNLGIVVQVHQLSTGAVVSTSGLATVTPSPNLGLCERYVVTGPDYPCIRAFRKAADEFEVYIRDNGWMIASYAE